MFKLLEVHTGRTKREGHHVTIDIFSIDPLNIGGRILVEPIFLYFCMVQKTT